MLWAASFRVLYAQGSSLELPSGWVKVTTGQIPTVCQAGMTGSFLFSVLVKLWT